MNLVAKNPRPRVGFVGCELILKANLGSLRRMEMRKKERFQVGLYL